MTPREIKLKQKRDKDLSRERKSQTFFDVPYGTKACTCGKKIVAHGRCQECYDKFRDEIKMEHAMMKLEIKEDHMRLRKIWKLF